MQVLLRVTDSHGIAELKRVSMSGLLYPSLVCADR